MKLNTGKACPVNIELLSERKILSQTKPEFFSKPKSDRTCEKAGTGRKRRRNRR
jgi:hypothetical protein